MNKKYLILTMGGSGTRFGATIPKQYTIIDGIPIFVYLLSKINSSKLIDGIIIVSNENYLDITKKWITKMQFNKVINVVKNGSTRTRSVVNGVNALKNIANYDDIIMIHDSTHPYFDEEAVKTVIEKVNIYGAATVVSREFDTVYRTNNDEFINEEIPKKEVIVGASPEAIKYGIISEIYNKASEKELDEMTSVGAIALTKNIKLAMVATNILNLKITHQEDMNLFSKLVHNYYFPEMKDDNVIGKKEL